MLESARKIIGLLERAMHFAACMYQIALWLH